MNDIEMRLIISGISLDLCTCPMAYIDMLGKEMVRKTKAAVKEELKRKRKIRERINE